MCIRDRLALLAKSAAAAYAIVKSNNALSNIEKTLFFTNADAIPTTGKRHRATSNMVSINILVHRIEYYKRHHAKRK